MIEHKEIYGFRFAKVEVAMVDYPDEKPFETTLLLDTLAQKALLLVLKKAIYCINVSPKIISI